MICGLRRAHSTMRRSAAGVVTRTSRYGYPPLSLELAYLILTCHTSCHSLTTPTIPERLFEASRTFGSVGSQRDLPR